MGVDEMLRKMSKPVEVEQEVMDKPSEEVIQDHERDKNKIPSYRIIEYNNRTKWMFKQNKAPRQGQRYCMRCVRFNGKTAYFILEPI